MAGLRTAAPGTRMAVLELAPPHIARQAEQGLIDLAFHTSEDAPQGMRHRLLFKERYVLAAAPATHA
jgi:DNA-binding transcriptional LysR family regulator